MNFKNFVITFFVLTLTGFTYSNSERWELAKEKDGVTVFTRNIQNEQLKEFKAVAEVKTNLHTLFTKIKDFKGYPNWVNDCEESYLVEKVSNQNLIYYIKFNTPWPVSDRDAVINFNIIEQTADRIEIQLTNLPERVEEKNKVVRMPKFNASWVLEKIGENKVKVTHIGFGDPGGSIPTWLANASVVDGPIATIANLINIVDEN